MAEPVEWLPDGTPRSPRFDDIYRSSTGGLEQARHTFLRGCGLPQAWSRQAQWRILETGFGLGLNFLATWRAWKDDPQRPHMLHFASVEAWPVGQSDLLRGAQPYAELAPLAQQLAQQWFGLTPGVHRLVFEHGRVLLTVHVGDVHDALRQSPFTADSVFLDGFDPRQNPRMWDLHTIKSVARHCRRGTALASWTAAGEVRRALAQCGFRVDKAEGLRPKRHSIHAVFAPAWELRGKPPAESATPGRCVVIGSGLAGVAVASSLARRGWEVTILDRAAGPAGGASSLPVGLLTPNFSPDDNLLSRLSRAGVRATLQQAAEQLQYGVDWRMTGVLECRRALLDPLTSATDSSSSMAPWTRAASGEQLAAAGLDAQARSLWHEHAGWIKPAALIQAWLSQPRVSCRGSAPVGTLERLPDGWRVLDTQGLELARAQLVVVAAAHASAKLVGIDLALQPVRGQLSWARTTKDALPPFCVNGNGHFVPDLPMGDDRAWVCGSTFERGSADLAARASDHLANLEQLAALLPEVARSLAPSFARGEVNSWTGVRCASADRRPLLGEVAPGLWVSTAMGSRGLTFSVLCAELLAARLHAEPLPLERKLAQALDVSRVRRTAGPARDGLTDDQTRSSSA